MMNLKEKLEARKRMRKAALLRKRANSFENHEEDSEMLMEQKLNLPQDQIRETQREYLDLEEMRQSVQNSAIRINSSISRRNTEKNLMAMSGH